jgi:hypothetical protein
MITVTMVKYTFIMETAANGTAWSYSRARAETVIAHIAAAAVKASAAAKNLCGLRCASSSGSASPRCTTSVETATASPAATAAAMAKMLGDHALRNADRGNEQYANYIYELHFLYCFHDIIVKLKKLFFCR